MPIHEAILRAALELCRSRGSWTFTPAEVVAALPHLNPRSVRTHVVSRCCTNAPAHHAHRWPYFERVRRGIYRVRPPYRRGAARVSEARAEHPPAEARGRDTIHAFVTSEAGSYVAETAEIAVVTQGRTLDEVTRNLREAVSLHLEGEDRSALGLADRLRLSVSLDVPFEHGASF